MADRIASARELQRGLDRVHGAIQHQAVVGPVLTEARRVMIEARFLLATGHSNDALDVLRVGQSYLEAHGIR